MSTPLDLAAGVKGQIQQLQKIRMLWFHIVIFREGYKGDIRPFSMMTPLDLDTGVKGQIRHLQKDTDDMIS